MIDEGLGAIASRSSARAGGPRASVSLALCAATLSSACSLMAVRSTPRTASGSERLVCASRVVPALDLTLVGVLGLSGLTSVAGSHDDGSGSFGDARRDGMFMAGAALLFLASSVYGFAGVASCHDRKRALELEADRREAVGAEPDTNRDQPRAGAVPWTPARPPAHTDPEAVARRRARLDAALALTRSAQRAARAHDCATVRSCGAQVLVLDAPFHASIFMRDLAIAACPTDAPAPRAGQ